MRRLIAWLVTGGALALWCVPCYAATVTVQPPLKPKSFWAGTRLKLAAERDSSGSLQVTVAGTVASASAVDASLFADGCSAGPDSLFSRNASPEQFPPGTQAVPSSPIFLQDGKRLDFRLRGKKRIAYSATVSYGWFDAPKWTDCVAVFLVKRTKRGDSASAFDWHTSTLYLTVTLADGRHIACGPAPAFCPQQRPIDT